MVEINKTNAYTITQDYKTSAWFLIDLGCCEESVVTIIL